MNAFVAYNVSKMQGEVEAALKAIGYWDKWVRTGTTTEIYNLPISCLWKPNIELINAKTEVINVVDRLNSVIPVVTDKIVLLQCIVQKTRLPCWCKLAYRRQVQQHIL